MSTLFSKALIYLGLVDEEQLDGDPRQEPVPAAASAPQEPDRAGTVRSISPEGRRVEPSHSASRTSARSEPSVAGVRPLRGGVQADILVIEEFGDAKILADRVRDRVPVVMDFRMAGNDLTRRVVDFSSGLIYALDGTMSKVGEGLVMVLPPGVRIDDAEKRRLAALGAYEID